MNHHALAPFLDRTVELAVEDQHVTTTLRDFLADNPDAIDRDDEPAIAATLARTGRYVSADGAADTWTLTLR